jgi:hypothetical protein
MTTLERTLQGALIALVATIALPAGAAEAGWRDYAYKHGAGYYIEKYVDKYVTEDNRYKGSKRTKTAKSGNSSGGTKSASKSGKSSTQTASLESGKPYKSTKTTRSIKTEKTTVSLTKTSKKPVKTNTEDEIEAAPEPAKSKARVEASAGEQQEYGEPEAYGPPMPKELETAAVTN